jgi:hypothetical protein
MINIGKTTANELYEKNVRTAVNTRIIIDELPLSDLIRESAEKFNMERSKSIRSGDTAAWDPESEVEQLSQDQRSMVAALIRHKYSNYDDAWQQFYGLSGGAKAHQILKDKTFKAIKSVYPGLLLIEQQDTSPIFPTVTISPMLDNEELEQLANTLTTEEMVTVKKAINEEITISLRPIEQLLEATNIRMGLPLETDHFSPDRDKNLSRRFVREAVREALAAQSNFEDIALTYLNLPGFEKAWDILYMTVTAELGRRYPRLTIAFDAAPSYTDRDWKSRVTTIHWVTSTGVQRFVDLRAITTTYRHMLATAGKRIERLSGQEAYESSILDVCLDDYTNFQADIALPYETEIDSDPAVELGIMRQVLRSIESSHPILRKPVGVRTRALESACDPSVIKDVFKGNTLAPTPEDLTKRKTHQLAVQKMVKAVQIPVAVVSQEAAGTVAAVADSHELRLEEQCQKVRQLMHSHPDLSKNQSAWMKLQPSMQTSARLIAMFRMHFSILIEHPELAEAVAHEVKRHERKIVGKS